MNDIAREIEEQHGLGAALEAAGVATAEEAAAVVERTSAFYAPTRAGTPSWAAATSGGGGPGR